MAWMDEVTVQNLHVLVARAAAHWVALSCGFVVPFAAHVVQACLDVVPFLDIVATARTLFPVVQALPHGLLYGTSATTSAAVSTTPLRICRVCLSAPGSDDLG